MLIHNKLFGFYYYKNPLLFWTKVKDIFKKPPLHIHIGKYRYMMMCDWIRIPPIGLFINGLGWKDKYNSPRFETPPNILIKIFNFEIRFIWTWIIKYHSWDDYNYWVSILDKVVYKREIDKSICGKFLK